MRNRASGGIVSICTASGGRESTGKVKQAEGFHKTGGVTLKGQFLTSREVTSELR